MITVIVIAWILQTLVGQWVCINSCANAYWKDVGYRNECGIRNFETICDYGLFWNLLPVFGFLATYSFITSNGKVRWDAITLRMVKEAWE